MEQHWPRTLGRVSTRLTTRLCSSLIILCFAKYEYCYSTGMLHWKSLFCVCVFPDLESFYRKSLSFLPIPPSEDEWTEKSRPLPTCLTISTWSEIFSSSPTLLVVASSRPLLGSDGKWWQNHYHLADQNMASTHIDHSASPRPHNYTKTPNECTFSTVDTMTRISRSLSTSVHAPESFA